MPENKQQKNIHSVKGLLRLWADTLAKQKADESLAIMYVYMNLDINMESQFHVRVKSVRNC